MLRQASLTGFRTENPESIKASQHHDDNRHAPPKSQARSSVWVLNPEWNFPMQATLETISTTRRSKRNSKRKKAWMRRNTQSIRNFWQNQLPTATWGNMKQRVRPIFECMCFFLTTFWSLELSPSGIPTWSNGQTLPKTWHGFSSNSARLGFIFTLSLAPIKAMTLGRQWPEQLHKQAGWWHFENRDEQSSNLWKLMCLLYLTCTWCHACSQETETAFWLKGNLQWHKGILIYKW